MARLIDADALREFLIKAGRFLKAQDDHRSAAHAIGKIIEHLDRMPTVGAVEVVRGKWNHDGSNWENRFICDQCGYKWFFGAEEAKFCPNCGAKMEGK